jgi:hypothetical protein
VATLYSALQLAIREQTPSEAMRPGYVFLTSHREETAKEKAPAGIGAKD